jgi:hypothetical protein
MDQSSLFYESLTALEKEYWQALHDLFQRVNPRRPEKGIQALLLRARQQAQAHKISLELALAQILKDATERTERRLQLLNQCTLPVKEPLGPDEKKDRI